MNKKNKFSRMLIMRVLFNKIWKGKSGLKDVKIVKKEKGKLKLFYIKICIERLFIYTVIFEYKNNS